MKKLITLLFVIFSWTFSAFDSAAQNPQTIISGYVTDSNGVALANVQVCMGTDSTVAPYIAFHHCVQTNANGYYIDTVPYSGRDTRYTVYLIDCQGKLVSQELSLPGQSTANFMVCPRNTVPCKAALQITSQGSTVMMYGNATGAAPFTYYWTTGDGGTSTQQYFSYMYVRPGVYPVCLYITDANGCRSSACDSVAITSANPCVAAFSVIDTAGGKQFLDQSTGNITSWYWDFGDGSYATDQYPFHVYQQSGTYNVTLTISGPNGCQTTSTQTVIVSGGTSFCKVVYSYTVQGNTVSFVGTATGTAPFTYSWSTGDGGTGTQATLTYTFPRAGVYPVCLYITDANGCRSFYCDSISVGQNTPCVAAFSVIDTAGGKQFMDQSTGNITSWYWDFGDGNNSSAQYPFHVYPQPGTYVVTLTITGPNGCQSTSTQTVVASSTTLPCKVYFQRINQGATYQFEAHNTNGTGVVQYTWRTSDGASGTGATFNQTFTTGGLKEVCVTMSDEVGCSSTYCDSIFVEVNTQPCTANFTYRVQGNTVAFQDLSQGQQPIAYSWKFSDGTMSSDANPTHTFTVPGRHQVCLAITAANGCRSYFCDSITIDTPPSPCYAKFNFSTRNFTAAFENLSTGVEPARYYWSFGDGTYSDLKAPYHNYGRNGSYLVCLTIIAANGCTDSTCQTVRIGTAPEPCKANFSMSVRDLRAAFQNTSTGAAPITYLWNFGDGSTSAEMNPVHNYPRSGKYPVCLTITAGNGCRDTKCDTANIMVPVPCVANFEYFDSAGTYFFRDLSTGGPTRWVWNFGDGSTSYEQNPNHVYTQAGTYTVTLTIMGTNCQQTVTKTIVVTSGSNDRYIISGTIALTRNLPVQSARVYLITYNAQTQILAAVDSLTLSATGNYKFNNVPQGTYFVKAALLPNDPNYSTFLPTYFGDGLYWYTANNLSVGPSYFGANINMVSGTNPGGPGFVGGNVTQGANKTSGQGDPIYNASIIIRGATNGIVMYVYTRPDGTYEFSNLPYGDYYLGADVLGRYVPEVKITLSSQTPSVTDVKLVTTKNIPVAIEVARNPYRVQAYPNPVQSDFHVSLSGTGSEAVSLQVLNLQGQVVYSNTQAAPASGVLSYTLDALVPGVYTARVVVNGHSYTTRILKQ